MYMYMYLNIAIIFIIYVVLSYISQNTCVAFWPVDKFYSSN